MTDKVRRLSECLGLTGEVRVVRDFFGLRTGVPSGQRLSLLDQMNLLQGLHIHLNVFLVGSDQFDTDDREAVDDAIQQARDILAAAGLGIGRIRPFVVTTAEADGFENIGGDFEAMSLTREFAGPNAGIDAFFVLTYAGDTAGFSVWDGPCANDGFAFAQGLVVEIASTLLGNNLAHEIGHYLGLFSHHPSIDNLMFANGGGRGTALNADQVADILQHCKVQQGC